MSHEPSRAYSRSYENGSGRFARRLAMMLAVTLTAAHPGTAIARNTAATDAATANIRVSVSPYYNLARVGTRQAMGRDPADGLCLATNAKVASMPVNGAVVGGDGIVEFTIPACNGHRSRTASEQIWEPQKKASLLLVHPE